jgi:hypothetical protein
MIGPLPFWFSLWFATMSWIHNGIVWEAFKNTDSLCSLLPGDSDLIVLAGGLDKQLFCKFPQDFHI